jgi:hypothetical protein
LRVDVSGAICRFVDKKLETYFLLDLPNSGPPPVEAQDESAIGVFQLAGKLADYFSNMYNTQLGGTYVVEAGGRVLMEHRQADVGEYVEHSYILKALGIDPNESPLART